MRGSILLLLIVMFVLIANIVTYMLSEDYRFFVKKIKYQQEVVYENQTEIDDSLRITLDDTVFSETSQDTNTLGKEVSREGFTFLDALGIEDEVIEKDTLLELNLDEIYLLEQLEEKFVLTENIASTSLFDITTEYPDVYHEYANAHLSVYMFSTKSYQEVHSIFKVLQYELPYTLNETNNFGENSFYINLDGVYTDDKVRIVFEYQNKAFGLKIKKDSYNATKEILDGLRAQK